MPIKDFVPPYLLKLRSRKKQFASYEDAIASLQNQSYENKDLCNVVAQKTKAYISATLTEQIEDADFFLLAIINMYLQEIGKTTITVVDFGGACGVHYFTMQKLLSNTNITLNWIVVETTEMVNAAIAAGLQTNNLKFLDSLSKITDSVDVLHSSCALHYVSKPMDVLQQMLKLNPKFLAFNRMFFDETENAEAIFIQTSKLSNNGIGAMPSNFKDQTIQYPCTLFSLKKFRENIGKTHHTKMMVKQPNERSFLCGMKINKLALLYEIKEK